MRNIIENTGFCDQIIESTTAIMSDRCASQLAANRDFIKNIIKDVAIVQLSCFMHFCSNMEKKFCAALKDLAPDV